MGWHGMAWDGEGRISVWRSGKKGKERKGSFLPGQDKSMIYQPTFVASIEADAYSTGVID
jgi:hypothetical protein